MRSLRERGVSSTQLSAWVGLLLAIIGSAITCTLFVVDRVQAVADRAAVSYATRDEIQALALDVRTIRDDIGSIKERLARAGINHAPGGGR